MVHLLRNKANGQIHPFTAKELEQLKGMPDLYKRFEEVTPEAAPTPPELALLNTQRNDKAQTNKRTRKAFKGNSGDAA